MGKIPEALQGRACTRLWVECTWILYEFTLSQDSFGCHEMCLLSQAQQQSSPQDCSQASLSAEHLHVSRYLNKQVLEGLSRPHFFASM